MRVLSSTHSAQSNRFMSYILEMPVFLICCVYIYHHKPEWKHVKDIAEEMSVIVGFTFDFILEDK